LNCEGASRPGNDPYLRTAANSGDGFESSP
jgi:hypothetical protein